MSHSLSEEGEITSSWITEGGRNEQAGLRPGPTGGKPYAKWENQYEEIHRRIRRGAAPVLMEGRQPAVPPFSSLMSLQKQPDIKASASYELGPGPPLTASKA